MRTTLVVLIGITVAACASAKETEAPAKPAQEVVSGAARIRSAKFRMDVEVGRSLAQRPTQNTTLTATPAAPVIK